MAIEIERKFLLRSNHILEGREGSYFLQSYLAKGAVLLRVRVTQGKAWLTIKGAALSSMSRPEWEYEIPQEDARQMARQPGAYGLEKTRFYIAHGGLTYEVDQYHGGLSGLYTVEVELDAVDTPVDLPDWVGDELTGNHAWDNESLARNGRPE